MLVELLTLGSFIICAIVAFLIGRGLMRFSRDPISERLAESARENSQAIFRESLAKSLAEQLPQTKLDNGLLDKELRRAGYYRPMARQEYLALRNGLVILAILITGTLVVMVGPESSNAGWKVAGIGLLAAVFCWALPRIFLSFKGNQRVGCIRRGLPDSLDMITMCLTGGLSLPDSLAHVSRELYFAHPDLSVELAIVREQADMTSYDLAFRQFAHRIDAHEVTALVALVTQSQRLGTDTASAIRDYADSVRLARRQTADERSSKASIKMLLPLTLCLLPSIFILLWGPAALELWDFFRNLNAESLVIPQ